MEKRRKLRFLKVPPRPAGSLGVVIDARQASSSLVMSLGAARKEAFSESANWLRLRIFAALIENRTQKRTRSECEFVGGWVKASSCDEHRFPPSKMENIVRKGLVSRVPTPETIFYPLRCAATPINVLSRGPSNQGTTA